MSFFGCRSGMHVGVHPRTLISRLIAYLTRSLEVAFPCHVAWLATIQVELVLEASVFLLLGEYLEFLGKCIDLGTIFFCSGGMVLECYETTPIFLSYLLTLLLVM